MSINPILNEYNIIREEIFKTTNKLLIGPFEEHEVLENIDISQGPSDFYLTGILWPRNKKMEPLDEDSIEINSVDGDSDESNDISVPVFNVFKPSSIGLTCSLLANNTPFSVVIRGARYEIINSDIINENKIEKNKNRNINWKRVPFTYVVNISADEKRNSWYENEFISSDGDKVIDNHVSLYIKRRIRKDCLIVTVSMINNSNALDDGNWNERCLYQTSIELFAHDEIQKQGIIISRNSDKVIDSENIKQTDLLYLSYSEFATGHGVSALWEEPQDGFVSKVWTSWMPYYRVKSVSAKGHSMLDSLTNNNSLFSAEFLSKIDRKKEIIQTLYSFTEIYKNWINDQFADIKKLPEKYHQIANDNLKECLIAEKRILQGINCLENNDEAFKAFCYANRVMHDQSISQVKKDDARPLVWRPFQLAFIILSLESIVNKDSVERKTMDLLWFPTGGGKTEAYLGLTIFTIFFRRIANQSARGKAHVDVLMRYTLRLLTVQQFQRAATMICSAELLRKEFPDDLGSIPISIGLFVGESTTPNKLLGPEGKLSAKSALEEEMNGRKPSSTPRLLLNCPLCGHDLLAKDYKVFEQDNKMEIRCSKPGCSSKGSPLPVHTVDQEIYKNLPSLLIGTIDKFAQLPRNENLGRIFGKPEGISPDLIIQDELHLISGPLGTITGLYETVVDFLCTSDGIAPKVIGSTATIERAEKQIRSLFDRNLMQFPPPGLNADDSFFAIKDHLAPDRLYIGLTSSGRSPKFVLQAAAAAFLVAAKNIHEIKGPEIGKALDPYWSIVLYFNSLKELGGAYVMMRDDVPRSMSFFSNRIGCPISDLKPPMELTSRCPSKEIPEKLRQIKFPLDGDLYENQPEDIVLASNMISVGMDIPRLGSMIVNGQPKSTAEYIQATSRVGREFPGIVLTVYNSGRPRDLSHFEHFMNYHQALYKGVEAVSVTPWSSRARDKALHAVFTSCVRHTGTNMSDRFSALNFNNSNGEYDNIKDWIIDRAINSGAEYDEVEIDLSSIIQSWNRRASNYRQANKEFEYWATFRPFNNTPIYNHLMRSAEDESANPEVWSTPNSMREVEPSVYCSIWETKFSNKRKIK